MSSYRLLITKTRRRIAKHDRLLKAALSAGCFFILFFLATTFFLPAAKLLKETVFGTVNPLAVVLGTGPALKSDEGRTNILLLGIGGGSHEGPDLTDTMIIVSLPNSSRPPVSSAAGTIYLVTIPRDIYLADLNDKINFAYSFGQEKRSGGGLTLSEAAVRQVTGLPIHYGIRVDFTAFEKIIDLVGGVDIEVERAFDDFQYPLAGSETDNCGFTPSELAAREATMSLEIAYPCRYEHLHFAAGLTHMNGATALKFVRSRHAEGEEGSDFARSRRQQKLILAFRNKLLSLPNLLSPQKMLEIYKTLKSHVDTDVGSGEMNTFLRLWLKLKDSPVKNINIDENLLVNPPIDQRGWILLPRDADFTEVHDFLRKQIFP